MATTTLERETSLMSTMEVDPSSTDYEFCLRSAGTFDPEGIGSGITHPDIYCAGGLETGLAKNRVEKALELIKWKELGDRRNGHHSYTPPPPNIWRLNGEPHCRW